MKHRVTVGDIQQIAAGAIIIILQTVGAAVTVAVVLVAPYNI